MFLVLKFLSSEIFWGKKLLASIMHYVFGLMQVGIFFFFTFKTTMSTIIIAVKKVFMHVVLRILR